MAASLFGIGDVWRPIGQVTAHYFPFLTRAMLMLRETANGRTDGTGHLTQDW